MNIAKRKYVHSSKITDTAFEDFVSHQKPHLQDVPTDHNTKLDLEKLLEDNKDAFAEDESK